jgi:hypothetical protein
VAPTYVLTMQYDPTTLGGAPADSIDLDWYDPTVRQWEPAVLGNTGSNDIRRFLIAYDGDLTPGHYGVDTVRHEVWAVLNHASQFAAALPEPSALLLLAFAALTLGIAMIKRR